MGREVGLTYWEEVFGHSLLNMSLATVAEMAFFSLVDHGLAH